MQNAEIANLLTDYADLLEIEGANAFRTRAYRNAARTIDQQVQPITNIINDETRSLDQLSGIGKDLAKTIEDIVTAGQFAPLIELQERIPPDVRAMLRIQGIGPKKVATLFQVMGITTLDDLKTAAIQHKIAEQKGFGKKTEQIILEGIEHLDKAGNRIYLADALPLVEQITNDLRASKDVIQISIAGSARRAKETVGDLDLLVTSENSESVMQALAEHPLVESVLMQGETKQRVRLKPLVQPKTPGGRDFPLELDLRVVPEKSFGAAMQYFTGSKEHNVILRSRAKQQGMSLNEYGLTQGEKTIASATEQEIYAALNLTWVAPELREGRTEIEAAEQAAKQNTEKQKQTLPELVTLDDIQADLHMHTTATDGTASILEMAEAAQARGLKYIAITDHSKRVTMANGLDETRLRKHWDAIRKINDQIKGIEILCGIECDILEEATMDLSDDCLKEADWVIAVLHYGLKQPREQITKRLLTAIDNPYVDMIGHMTGRIIGKRPAADIDTETVFQAAAQNGVMMEINAHPARLDLHELHTARAKELGIPIVINTDAHSVTGFEVLQWGVKQARRAGLTKNDVANTQAIKPFLKSLRRNS